MIFPKPMTSQDALRAAITHAYRQDETACVNALLDTLNFSAAAQQRVTNTAAQLVMMVRKQRVGQGGLDAFLQQYDLSSEEGVVLMCLAEALLRVPDKTTIDKLIRDKITSADWAASLNKSESFFVNATTWGLMLTGKLLSAKEGDKKTLQSTLKNLLSRAGEPIIRKATNEAIKILGRQFVMGQNIEAALQNAAEKSQYRYSFDMLGEAARTAEDAERYFKAYQNAIAAIGKSVQGQDIASAPSISVKLSALHPRYEFAEREIAVPAIVKCLRELSLEAKQYGIGLTVDAEESYRLDISLDTIETVFSDPKLASWNGFGLAVQAYQKRAMPLIDWLIALARKNKRGLMVRLVKGAYWDSEVKDSQVRGLDNYPVFTRKATTDVSYLACAQKLIAAEDVIYPQFATHNAHTIAAILEMMGDRRNFEFQRLKGMGEPLYNQIVGKDKMGLHCRVYAPVGKHEDLLPYLVRRLLENGANTSFVNRIVDEAAPIEEIIADPIAKVRKLSMKPHPKIPLPRDVYGADRKNSRGLDLTDMSVLEDLQKRLTAAAQKPWLASPLIGTPIKDRQTNAIYNPADHRQMIGTVIEANKDDVEQALTRAKAASEKWEQTTVEKRAALLEKVADLFEENMPEMMAIIVREGGKVIPDAVAEIREAVDFCRYYAEQARVTLTPKLMPGPTGETNQLSLHGRGIMVCISPWNFPLAIFAGQITAALAAGNTVIAKPAEQTPLIAAKAVSLMHQAGIPDDVLQLLPGRGEIVGAQLVADPRIAGVIFTGSTETAKIINQTLANRKGSIPVLIAETGGQNALIADSTALPEQLVMDVLTSGFYSAGQRCSALRVLFVQEDIADKVTVMLKGAMAELKVGDPALLNTDIGPVIDEDARRVLQKHQEKLNTIGKLIYQAALPAETKEGTFFAPCAYEIASLELLEREVFGPILHVVRFKSKELKRVIEVINNTGYGLTLGVHTRIESTADYITKHAKVGNMYINRNMIGAVVGVQPFGGEGLSGTGPKAGGPHYLPRLCVERVITINTTATGGNAALLVLGEE